MGQLPFVPLRAGQGREGQILMALTGSVWEGNILTISIKCKERRGEEKGDKIKFWFSLSKLRLAAGLLNYFSRK